MIESEPCPAPRHRFLRAAQIVVSLVSLFWIGFAMLDGLGHLHEPVAAAETLTHVGIFVAPLALIALAAWSCPVLGGVLALIGGILAGLYFEHPAPRLLMSAPLILAGIALAISGRCTTNQPAR